MGSGRERIDIFDEDGNHLGTMRRAAAHQSGAWHHTFHCWVVAQRPFGPAVLFQRRHRNAGGRLDASAGGHFRAGESTEQAARELQEELNCTAQFTDLNDLGVFPVAHGRAGCDHEVAHVFSLYDDRPLRAWEFDHHEAFALVEVAAENLQRLHSGLSAPAMQWDGNKVRTVMVTPADLAPYPNEYWLAVSRSAELSFIR